MRSALCIALLALGALASTAAAQGGSVDIIRGRVTGPGAQPVANATVTAQSLSDETTRSARTNADGRFTILFAGGGGDYMMSFIAIGMVPLSFEVQKTSDDDAVVLANARMEGAPQQLDAVRINGRQRPTAADANRPDIGGVEQNMNSQGIPVDVMGDLSAMAAYLPGVTAIANADGTMGFSVLGLSPDQNNISLNGLTFGGTLPRDVQVSARLSTTTFDPSRGGFSGGQITARTFSGSNYVNRTLHVTFDHPDLQWASPTSRALGQQYTNVVASGALSGPLVWNKLFYNTSFQIGQQSSGLQTLLNTSASGLESVGIAQDSVNQLLSYMQGAGIPATLSNIPGTRLNDQGALFAQLGFSPTGTDTWGLLFNGSWNQSGGASLGTSAVPAHGGQTTRRSGTLQLTHAGYFGYGFLNETSASFSATGSDASAYLLLPSASVLVTSTLPGTASGVSSLQFGGNSSYPQTATNFQWEFSNATSWFSDDNTHRLKLTEDVQVSRYIQNQNANSRGTFVFSSLAALEANQPTSFTRRLAPAIRSGDVVTYAASIGDAWRPLDALQVQYGFRAEASRFSTAPQYNPLVDSVFGLRNSVVPNDVTVSPRVGFTWRVGSAPEIEGFRGAFHPPLYVISGGVGEFRNNPTATLISSAVDQTGLTGAAQQVTCVGAAVPTPDWAAYAQNPASVPSTCADGSLGTVFANSAPNVTLFSPGYRTQRSWRGNIGIQGMLTPLFNENLTFTYSRNYDQRGTVNANFADVVQFTLPAEDNRPVYVAPTAIVPSTGAIAAGANRLSPAFSQVSEAVSDLRSYTRELQFGISPRQFNSTVNWTLTYVYRDTKQLARGFGDYTAGDPLATYWAGSGPQHQFNLNTAITLGGAVSVSTFVRVSSGNRFTPAVAGDVNGDGSSNDRAFVFDPATVADTAVRDGMQALLGGLSGSTRRCLETQLGTIAGRNSCAGPWSVSMSALNVQLVSDRVGLPSRMTVGLSLSNPLTGVDAMVHGDRLAGWGQQPVVDPTLLYVRGFDPNAKTFKYEVNPRFGAAPAAQIASYSPFRATLDVRLAVGPDRNLQQLEQLLRGGGRGGRGGMFGGRGGPGGDANARAASRPSETMIKNRYVRGYPNPMDQLLRQKELLALTDAQTATLIKMNKAFTASVDSIWTPVAHYLAGLPEQFDVNDAFSHVSKGQDTTIALLVAYAPRVKGLLTAAQLQKLPAFLAAFLDPETLREIRPGGAFGFGFGGGAGGMGRGGFGGGGRGGRGG
ncbi:MAG: carboxypeptidase regulatory-like domain-containing protein [Gemmatimonadota bacterium]|nr:carboxypeptidase regulatory-like domain-containing protein [Gemmatimonadota bacterium]